MARCSDSCSAPSTQEAEEETEWVAGQSGLKTKTVSRRPVRQGQRERTEEELTQTKGRQKTGVGRRGPTCPTFPSYPDKRQEQSSTEEHSVLFLFELPSRFEIVSRRNTRETRLIGANVTHQII